MIARPVALPACLLAAMTAAMIVAGPIAQLDNYHAFADQRVFGAIPYAADVLSNLGFFAVGAWGLWWSWCSRGIASLDAIRPGYAMFFAALLLTAFGSAWYHLAPDDTRLVLDRLPIALACAALVAVALRGHLGVTRWVLPALVVFAAASVGWWVATADLRPYLLLQAAPVVLVPAVLYSCGAPADEKRAYGWALGLYVLAKLAELSDAAVFMLLPLSGHTLKHLLATAAAGVIAAHVAARVRIAR